MVGGWIWGRVVALTCGCVFVGAGLWLGVGVGGMGLGLGVGGALPVCRFSCLFTFYEYKQTNVNGGRFLGFAAGPCGCGVRCGVRLFWGLVGAFNSARCVVLGVLFFRVCCLCFSDVNKWY